MSTKLTVVKVDGMDDWYLIERAEHDGREWMERLGERGAQLMVSARISDADVEGFGSEMLAIADAIERRGNFSAKRCAVSVLRGGAGVEFWSPRNSQRPGRVELADADELAKLIRATVAG